MTDEDLKNWHNGTVEPPTPPKKVSEAPTSNPTVSFKKRKVGFFGKEKITRIDVVGGLTPDCPIQEDIFDAFVDEDYEWISNFNSHYHQCKRCQMAVDALFEARPYLKRMYCPTLRQKIVDEAADVIKTIAIGGIATYFGEKIFSRNKN